MKKQKKTGRRFIQHVKVKKVYGKAVEIPKELQTSIHTREPDHVAQFTCPLCGAVRYVTQAQLDFVAELGKQMQAEGGMEVPPFAAVSHKPCKAIMHLEMLEGQS